MTEEKLPKEISIKRKAVQELQKVASTPAIDHNDITQIQDKVDTFTKNKNLIFSIGMSKELIFVVK